MIHQNYISIIAGLILFMASACEQDNKAYCSCLEQAQKVNKLSAVIWSGGANHQDTIALKKALASKEKLCQTIQQSKDKTILELKGTCN
jgi:hypothetical protein